MENEKVFVIKVTDSNITYDTEMSPEESIFWLDAAKYMIMKRVFDPADPPSE